MNFCSNCGKKVDGNKFCTKCGNRLDNVNSTVTDGKENSGLKTVSIVLGILGIVGSVMVIFSPFGFILSLIGLILAIIAIKKVKNVIGIVLNSIGLFLSVGMIIIVGLLIRFAINNYNGYNQNYYDNEYDKFYNDFNSGYFDFDDLDEYFNGFFNDKEYDDERYSSDYYENVKDIISIY